MVIERNMPALIKARQGSMNERATAREIGISPTTLLKLKRGEIPDYKTFKKVCDWCGVEIAIPVKVGRRVFETVVPDALDKLIIEASEKFNRSINSVGHT